MATKTAGTKATTSLTAIQWIPGGTTTADLATINEAMRNIATGSFGASAATGAGIAGFFENGLLNLPDNKGVLRVENGDWIAVDALGWPVVIPKVNMASASSSWTHS